MKLFKSIKNVFASGDILLWAYPVLLTVPNLMLDLTERYSFAAGAANLLLPFGVYLLLMAWRRRTGATGLWMTFFAVFAAFQIVLLNLYGESIIAIDMFVNVATTNYAEATELLANLLLAIVLICVIYIPPIVASVVQICHGSESTAPVRRRALRTGWTCAVAGALFVGAAYASESDYRLSRELFPVNVLDNLCTAVSRTMASNRYEETSKDFSFGARSTHDADSAEVYVIVVGETSRAENWQLAGYGRETNPKLSHRSGLFFFPHALSESNTTHKSVPMILSPLDSRSYGDSIYLTRSIFDAFSEAGYSTVFISNQRRNHSFIDRFGEQAQSTDFIIDDFDAPQHDIELARRLATVIDTCRARKLFVVLHSYGSHFSYRERYPREYAFFTPESNPAAAAYNREQLLNAYDNSIRYTDAVLDSVVSILEKSGRLSSMLYLSDHGEDIFDDSRERFLHASPVGTYHQLHVPFAVWMSRNYMREYPAETKAVEANRLRELSSSASAFHTMLSLAGLESRCLDRSLALSDSCYLEPAHLFLNDYLEGVPLRDSGLRDQDFEMLDARGFTY